MVQIEHKKKSINTIEEAVRDFLAQSKSKIKESTFSRYSFICERHIIPYFEGIALDTLNSESIHRFTQNKLSCGGLMGKPLSPKSINDITCLLLQIIRNYCKTDIDIDKITHRQSEISVFTELEYSKLKSYLFVGLDNRKIGIIIAMLMGLRIGEICALQWKNIDLDKRTITVDKTIQRIRATADTEESKTKIIIDTPKSNAGARVIPIPEILLCKLEELKSKGNTYLLTNTADYIEPRIYQRYYKKYLELCAIKYKCFHTLRHTFATMAISKGMDIKTLSVFLGHTDISFTMKRYIHPNMEHKRNQIEKLAMGF